MAWAERAESETRRAWQRALDNQFANHTHEARVGADGRDSQHIDTQFVALLLRLGYSEGDALTMVRGAVRWDFELHGAPAHLARVAPIVAQVYARAGQTGGGTPIL